MSISAIDAKTIDAADFLQILYGDDAPGYLVLWMKSKAGDTSRTIAGAAKNIAGAGKFAMDHAGDNQVYFGIGLQKHKPMGNERGKTDTVVAIPGLWLDIDIAGPAHKATDLPPSLDAVRELLAKLPLQPTMMVHSGNGVHVWWLFRELWVFESAVERVQAMELVRKFQGKFINWAAEREWKIDNTSDLARVLRPPGTYNHKSDPPKPVTVLEYNEQSRYNPSDFDEYLLDDTPQPAPQPHKEARRELPANYPPADIAPIIEGCAWLKHCQTDAKTLPEPEWYAMLSILARCKNGEATAIEWSRDYPGFSMKETQKKFEQAAKTAGPRTCEDIYHKGGKAYCDDCPNRDKITSPVVLGLPKTPRLVNPSGLPEIDANNFDLPAIVDQAWEAVTQANNPPVLFQRGGMITRIRLKDRGQPYLEGLSEDALRGHLARIATWFKWQKIGKEWEKVPALPPTHVVKDMRSASSFPLPIIARVVEAPVFGSDGKLSITPGYHESSQTYFWDAGLQMPSIPAKPTEADITRAKSLLLEDLLGDFPFAGESELCHALAAILLPFARELIDGSTPLHMIEAPTAGTGKSLLADAIALIATGRPAAMMTEGKDEAEWGKVITAVLMEAPPIVVIDNVRGKLSGQAISSALTSTEWKDRILGFSQMVSLPVRCVWLATGNNPSYTKEVARRIVRIRLDAKMTKPWQRQGFRHKDLRSWIRHHRSDYVWAALTLIQAWIAAGRPLGDYTLGSYESWAHVMGGIMSVCGVPCFLKNLDELYESSDEETQLWEAFVAVWWDTWQDRPVSVRELHEMADKHDLLLPIRGDGNENSQKTRMGRAMKQMRDQVIGDWRVEAVGKERRGNTILYRLCAVNQSGASRNSAGWSNATTGQGEAAATFDEQDSPFV